MLLFRRSHRAAKTQRVWRRGLWAATMALVTILIGLVVATQLRNTESVRHDPTGDAAAVEAVEAGERTTARADWWGFDPNDATDSLQRAIDSRADRVIVPYVGKPWITRPLKLRSGLRLELEANVVLMAKEGAFRGKSDALLLVEDAHDVTIIGNGATVRMRKSDYRRGDYEKSEWRHGICLKGARNINIRGLHIEQSGGDGIYVGPTWDKRRIPCSKIRIADCKLVENYRQGISIVSGMDVVIENCEISKTSGTAPQAGIDLEPSHPDDQLTDILIRRCAVRDNAGSGFMTNLSRLSARSRPISVRIEDCSVSDSVQPGLRTILHKDQGATGTFEFERCTVTRTQYAGARIIWDTSSPIRLRFTDCRWTDVGRRAGQSPLSFELTRRAALRRSGLAPAESDTPEGGRIEFRSCVVLNRGWRNVVDTGPSDADARADVRGDIAVYGDKPAGPAPGTLPNLSVVYKGPRAAAPQE